MMEGQPLGLIERLLDRMRAIKNKENTLWKQKKKSHFWKGLYSDR